MLHPDYPIETERLLLRPLDPDRDVEAVHAYESRPDVCRYIPYPPRSLGETRAKLEQARSTLEAPGQALRLALVRRDCGELIGDVMLFWVSDEHRSGEIGYVLHPDHQGHGYATGAGTALLDLAFAGQDRSGLGLHRVTARLDARNPASANVLRGLGMRQEAALVENERFKGEWTTGIDFAILAAEWRALAARSRARG